MLRKTILKSAVAMTGLGLSVGLVVSMSTPADTSGYNLLGGSLGLGQRDFRVYNDFADVAANNNTTAHPNFPGHTGAVMALWKCVVEWSSGHYAGDGEGDTTQSFLGTGSANFDSTFQGTTNAVGGQNDNIMSPLHQNGGSVFAFMEPGFTINDGWRIRFYDNQWTWSDGPGTIGGSQADLQGIGCHEYGHALGLDHSGNGSATMKTFGSLSDEGQRSINFDDVDGVQAIYGVKAGNKPEITSIAGSTNVGETLIINGVNFSSQDNVIWFTKANSNGVPTKVNNVDSPSGTQLSVVVPADAVDGEVHVKGNFAGDESLSNPWPLDVDSTVNQGAFVDIGPGIGGAFGVPALDGDGDLTPGSATGFTLSVTDCPPSAFGIYYWTVGGGGAVPFKGGTFYVIPLILSIPINTDPSGEIILTGLSWDASTPSGLMVTIQYWCSDATAPFGSSGTNGLRMDIP